MAHSARQRRREPTKSEQKKEFLLQLECVGNVSMAADNVGVARRTIYNWIDADAKFKADFERSSAIADNLLVDEAQRRAFHGTMKPIYQGGVLVGYESVYSDRLLELMLKGKKRDVFGDKTEVFGPGDGTIKFEVSLKKPDKPDAGNKD